MHMICSTVNTISYSLVPHVQHTLWHQWVRIWYLNLYRW